MSIRSRLILMFVAVTAIGFTVFVKWMIDDLRPRYLASMEEVLVDCSQLMAASVSSQIRDERIVVDGLRRTFDDVKTRSFSAQVYELKRTHVDIRIYVVDKDGIVLFDSDGRDKGADYSKWNDVIHVMRGQYGTRATRVSDDDPSSLILHIAAPILHKGKRVGVLTVCKPTAGVHLFLDIAKRRIIQSTLVALLFSTLVAYAVSWIISRPIHRLQRYAQNVRDGKRVDLPALGSSELKELGVAFEEMREALEGKQYVENYVQALTHEMKSPISAIRGASELLQEDMPSEDRIKFSRNIEREVTRLGYLVDRMLLLASLEKRRNIEHPEDIAVAPLLKDLVKEFETILSHKRICVETELIDDLAISGERFLLHLAFSNLLQNAIDFSPKEGAIRITMSQSEGTVTVAISDEGPGIPDFAMNKIFEKFYSLQRPDSGKKSTGLGLSFVQEIAQLHDAVVTIRNRQTAGAVATVVIRMGGQKRW